MRVGSLIAALGCLAMLSAVGRGQQPRHYFHAADLPPGTVAQGQLAHLPALRGYLQPVEIQLPDGARVAVKNQGQFQDTTGSRPLLGLQVGPVYQLRITNIPVHPGFEIYPTIELVHRLFPPEGKKLRFPVPVQFTQEELELALSGRFVTRVIYLEDPQTALPRAADPQLQDYFEVAPREDPLRVADRLGRPMAILRMGSRVPDIEDINQALGFGDPPVVIYPAQPPADAGAPPPQDAAGAIHRQGHDVPRLPIQPRPVPQFYPARYPTAR